MGFIDTMRAEGHAVESICRVLREQGCQVAARTYRAGSSPTRRRGPDRHRRPGRRRGARHRLDAPVDTTACAQADPRGALRAPEDDRPACVAPRCPRPAPARWTGRCAPSGCPGCAATRAIRTTIPAKDGTRAGDLLDRDFTAAAPNRTWVTDFTYVRTWAGFVYVAFIVDVFAQRIVAWHAATTKHDRPGDDPAADGAVAARPRGPPRRAGRADPSLRRRQSSTPRSGSPSTSRSRGSGPRSARSATPTTTP